MRIKPLIPFVLAMILLPMLAQAKPEYARKEQKPCNYCHLNGTPGALDAATGKRLPTTRNTRGMYYETHNHTFDGFRFAPVKLPERPAFKFLWKEEMTDLPRRIAVADVTGDGTPRLVTLNEKPDTPNASVLTVRKWDGKAFVTEFTGQVGAAAEKLQVGKFAGEDKLPLIVTADALWFWNGKTFERKPAGHLLNILGAVRLKNGQERLLLAESAKVIKAYRLRPEAAGNDWLEDPMTAPDSGQVHWESLHARPDFFDEMDMPKLLADGGLIGLWDIAKNGKVKLYFTKVARSIDVQQDAQNRNKPQFLIKGQTYSVVLIDPRVSFDIELWTSPRLETPPYDVVLESARGDGKPGMLILIGEPAKGKPRTLAFFGIE